MMKHPPTASFGYPSDAEVALRNEFIRLANHIRSLERMPDNRDHECAVMMGKLDVVKEQMRAAGYPIPLSGDEYAKR